MSALRGRRDEAIASLERAEHGFRSVEMLHYAAAAARRRGELSAATRAARWWSAPTPGSPRRAPATRRARLLHARAGPLGAVIALRKREGFGSWARTSVESVRADRSTAELSRKWRRGLGSNQRRVGIRADRSTTELLRSNNLRRGWSPPARSPASSLTRSHSVLGTSRAASSSRASPSTSLPCAARSPGTGDRQSRREPAPASAGTRHRGRRARRDPARRHRIDTVLATHGLHLGPRAARPAREHLPRGAAAPPRPAVPGSSPPPARRCHAATSAAINRITFPRHIPSSKSSIPSA